jgi:hypothetical protein
MMVTSDERKNWEEWARKKRQLEQLKQEEKDREGNSSSTGLGVE